MSKTVELVGQRIREYRKKKGLSLEELSHRAGLHTAHLGRIERGEKNVTLESIEKVINALGISFEEFFNFQSDLNDVTKESLVDNIVSYLKTMTKDEQNDIYKTIKMLVKWKGKS